MDLWLYKGKQVEVCDRYSSHWVYKELGGDGTGKQGSPAHFSPVNPASNLGQQTKPESSVVPVEPQVQSSGLPGSPSEFEINAATLAEIKKAFKGKVGSADSTKVFQRKPEGGYKGWEELIELNSDLGVNWEEVKLDLPIEVKF